MRDFKHSLLNYSIKRLLQGIPLIILVVLFSFAIIQFAPGEPISLIAGGDDMTQEQIDYLTEQWGLDQPIHIQMWRYCTKMLRFDLGISYRQARPVLDIILERLPYTLLLLIPSLLIATVIGVSVGVYCATHMHSTGDSVMTVAALTGYSVPLFWVGQMLLLIFAMKLSWFPVSGISDLLSQAQGLAKAWDVFLHLVLPGLSLIFSYSAMIIRVMRTKMAEVLQTDFIKTARAKGLPESKVIWGHGLRNALAPVVTVVGMELATMVMGATVVETVFGYPGTGRLIFTAISNRDYPLIAGMFFFISVGVILANVLVDILYAVLDPQVRYN